MPRTSLTPIDAPGAYGGALTALTFTAADVANKNQFTLAGNELLIIRNADAGAAHNVTLTSVDDERGRQENIAESVAASAFRIWGPAKLPGWMQTDGKFYLEADSNQIQFAVVRLPGL